MMNVVSGGRSERRRKRKTRLRALASHQQKFTIGSSEQQFPFLENITGSWIFGGGDGGEGGKKALRQGGRARRQKNGSSGFIPRELTYVSHASRLSRPSERFKHDVHDRYYEQLRVTALAYKSCVADDIYRDVRQRLLQFVKLIIWGALCRYHLRWCIVCGAMVHSGAHLTRFVMPHSSYKF